jgi:NTE family protein
MIIPKKYQASISSLDSLEKDTPIQLVLSGGGAKGVAHLALFEKIEALGLKIASISGASSGALFGAMYSSGKRPQEILDFFKNTPLFKNSWFRPLSAGFFDSSKYKQYLVDFIKDDFKDLNIPLYVSATNMENGEVYYFNKGDLITTVVASCAVPGLFSPVEIDGVLYSDGGVMDNFPISPFLEQDAPIVGSYLSSPPKVDKEDLSNPLKVLNRSASLLHFAANYPKFHQTSITVVHEIDEYPSFDQKHVDNIYETARATLFDEELVIEIDASDAD